MVTDNPKLLSKISQKNEISTLQMEKGREEQTDRDRSGERGTEVPF